MSCSERGCVFPAGAQGLCRHHARIQAEPEAFSPHSDAPRGAAQEKTIPGPDPGFSRLPFGALDGEAGALAQMKAFRQSGLSFGEIASRLNAAGIKPRRAAAWTFGTVQHVLRPGGEK